MDQTTANRAGGAGEAPNKRRWLLLFIFCLVPFMALLDANIVNVAMPVMSAGLSCSMKSIQWVVTIYIITVSAVILIFGKLGDGLGKRAIFMLGVCMFTLGSLLCGTSVSLPMLIVSRVLQAIGGAAAQSINQALITICFPPSERGRALGISGMSVAIGSLLGAPLGGLIVSVLSWHFIFLINVPFGVFTFLMTLKFLPKEDKIADAGAELKAGAKFDFIGAVLLIVSISGIFLGLNLGVTYGYNAPEIFMLCAGAVLFAAFVFFEGRSGNPILDFGIFKNKMFSLSLLCAFLTFASTSGIQIINPFYLQDLRGMGPGAAAAVMVAFPLVGIVTAPLSGYASDKLGSLKITLAGLCILSFGLFLLSTMSADLGIGLVWLFVAIVSFGNAVFNSPNTSMVMSSVPRRNLGVAGSLNALGRNLGIVFGIIISTSVFYSSMSYKIGYRVGGYVAGRPDVFIYGMRLAYLTAMALCLLGAALTAYRMISGRRPRGAGAANS